MNFSAAGSIFNNLILAESSFKSLQRYILLNYIIKILYKVRVLFLSCD
jgi:hypothetical protein